MNERNPRRMFQKSTKVARAAQADEKTIDSTLVGQRQNESISPAFYMSSRRDRKSSIRIEKYKYRAFFALQLVADSPFDGVR